MVVQALAAAEVIVFLKISLRRTGSPEIIGFDKNFSISELCIGYNVLAAADGKFRGFGRKL